MYTLTIVVRRFPEKYHKIAHCIFCDEDGNQIEYKRGIAGYWYKPRSPRFSEDGGDQDAHPVIDLYELGVDYEKMIPTDYILVNIEKEKENGKK